MLLSGGLDSTAVAALERPELCVFVDYGQVSADAERTSSEKIARELGLSYLALGADCSALGSGDLAGKPSLGLSPSREWWPFRNQLVGTLAAIRVIELGISELHFGTVSSDHFHADGTADFFSRFSALLSMQEGGLRVAAPYIDLSTEQLVRLSNVSDSVLGWSFSCHTGLYPCGICRGCAKRAAVLKNLGRLQ